MAADENRDSAVDDPSADEGASKKAGDSMNAAAALMGTPVTLPKIPDGMSRADYHKGKPGRETQNVMKMSGVKRRQMIIMIAVGVVLAAGAGIAMLMLLSS